METTKIAILDTETTGLDANKARICELGGVILTFEGSQLIKVESTLNTYINPGHPIPPITSAVHHITDKMVADAPKFEDLSDDINSFLASLSAVDFVGTYNIKFDWAFLADMYPDLDNIPEDKRVCFLRTFQKFSPDELNHQLQYLRYLYDFDSLAQPYFTEPIQAHRALSDVIITVGSLLHTLQNTTFTTWEEFFDTDSMTPNSIMFFGKHKGHTLLETFKDRAYVKYLMDQDWFKIKYLPVWKVLTELGK